METLITVVILGILAAILVPNLIKNQVENANRTKVKKAMAAYEKAINYIIIENDIKSSNGIKDFGEEENCKYASEYFKKVQKGDTDCVFKTPDKVWWNISDLTNPIIILKDELKIKNPNELRVLAKDFNDKNVFALIGRFDDLGSLRVDDNGFEQSQENNDDNKFYMTKLWGFINNQKTEPVKCEDYICKFKQGDYDTLCASNKAKDKFNCQYCYGNSYGNFCDVYDENGKRIVYKGGCDNNYLNCDRETIYWEDGTKRSESNACNSGVYESCLIISLFNEEGQITSKKVYKPSTEGYISGQCQINGSYAPINPECANKIYCNGTVCHVYDNNGSHRIKLYNCSDN